MHDDNYAALAVCILTEYTPEQSWQVLDHGPRSVKALHKVGRDPAADADMVAYRKQGLTYDQIAEIYGINRAAIWRRVKRAEKEVG